MEASIFENAVLGGNFTIYIDAQYKIDDVRKLFLEGAGLALHIKAKVGPTTIQEDTVVCDITAIDDSVLTGQVKCALPNIGMYVLIGYFKEA